MRDSLDESLHGASKDHFSSLFYETTFAGMPKIDEAIRDFRKEINNWIQF